MREHETQYQYTEEQKKSESYYKKIKEAEEAEQELRHRLAPLDFKFDQEESRKLTDRGFRFKFGEILDSSPDYSLLRNGDPGEVAEILGISKDSIRRFQDQVEAKLYLLEKINDDKSLPQKLALKDLGGVVFEAHVPEELDDNWVKKNAIPSFFSAKVIFSEFIWGGFTEALD